MNYLQAQGLTTNPGTPALVVAGYAQAATSPLSSSNLLTGIAMLPGNNLASNGQGASPVFGSIGFPGGAPVVLPHPPNQPNAVNIPSGAPYVDGLLMIALALEDTIFNVQVDNSGTGSAAATNVNVGQYATLVTDASNFWYLDLATAANTPGTLACVIESLDPLYLVPGSTTTQLPNGMVRIRFLPQASQMA